MTRDPARAAIEYALQHAEQRMISADGAIVRAVVGGQPYNSAFVMRERGKLATAIMDHQVAKRALAELDRVDGRTTEVAQ